MRRLSGGRGGRFATPRSAGLLSRRAGSPLGVWPPGKRLSLPGCEGGEGRLRQPRMRIYPSGQARRRRSRRSHEHASWELRHRQQAPRPRGQALRPVRRPGQPAPAPSGPQRSCRANGWADHLTRNTAGTDVPARFRKTAIALQPLAMGIPARPGFQAAKAAADEPLPASRPACAPETARKRPRDVAARISGPIPAGRNRSRQAQCESCSREILRLPESGLAPAHFLCASDRRLTTCPERFSRADHCTMRRAAAASLRACAFRPVVRSSRAYPS